MPPCNGPQGLQDGDGGVILVSSSEAELRRTCDLQQREIDRLRQTVRRYEEDAQRSRLDLVRGWPTDDCPILLRDEITALVTKQRFGERLCGQRAKRKQVQVYNKVAAIARPRGQEKLTDINSLVWTLEGSHRAWLDLPVNLARRTDRENLCCSSKIYSYYDALAGTLVVDFANRRVGGGCFSGAFVQEEQLVMESADLATRLKTHRQILGWNQAISYEGVYMDAWWPRMQAAKKERIEVAKNYPLLRWAVHDLGR